MKNDSVSSFQKKLKMDSDEDEDEDSDEDDDDDDDDDDDEWEFMFVQCEFALCWKERIIYYIFICLTNVLIFLFLFSDDDKKVKAVEKSPIKTPQKVSLAVSVHVHSKKRGKAVYYTAAQKFGVEKIYNALERSFICSPKLNLFNQKYSKTVIL